MTARERIMRIGCMGVAVSLLLLSGCGSVVTTAAGTVSGEEVLASTDEKALREDVELLLPEATGTTVFGDGGVSVDASNTDDGYIMVKSAENAARLKVRLTKDAVTYTYDLPSDGAYVTYPLSEGDGTYSLQVYEQVEGTSYALLFARELSVRLTDALSPFLYPNAYVSYDADTQAVLWSYAVCAYAETDGEKEKETLLYRYVADNIRYDSAKAAAAVAGNMGGYLPDVDETLSTGEGICFDYAALLACMLRVQRIPTRLVLGYVGPNDEYHAWNAVYLDGEWVLRDATLDKDPRGDAAYTTEKAY